MYNKKRSPFDPSLEDVSSSDPWIWGNQRGGGGAPLRDMDGNHLANLKKVLHGEVDVDHSPVSATKGPSSVRRLSPRERGDGYEVSHLNNSHVAVTTKKKISFQETDHRVRDRSSRRNKNDYSDDYRDDSYDEQQPFRQSVMRQDRNRDDRETPQQQQHRTQASSIPGLEHVTSPPKKFMSAVSDMHSGGGTSDRDMKMRKQQQYQQLLQQQIDEKQRRKEKERRDEEDRKRRELSEYYQSTQQQQAPMRSRSDRSYEDRDSRSDAVVRVGLDERREEGRGSSYEGYGVGRGSQGGVVSRNRPGRQVADSSDDEERSTHRGGSPVGKKPLRSIPPMIKLRQSSAADDDGSDADYLENDNSARLYNQRMKAKGGGVHAMQQEEARMAEGRRHSGEPSREQDYIRRQQVDDSEDEPPTHGPSGRPPRGKDVRRNVGERDRDRDRDNNDHRMIEGEQHIRRDGAAAKFVSMDEYDELSKLCDSLLAQQNQLKEELRSQAAALKALKRGEVSAGVGVAGRQQQNGAIKSSRGNAAAAMRMAPAALPPQSALSRSKSAVPTTGARDGRTKARDPPPGPASARPSSMHTAAASKDDGKAKAGHHQMRRSVSPSKKGGKIPNLAFGSNASSSSANGKDSRLPLKAQQAASNVLGSKSSSSSNSGFSKLQQSAAVRGPLVVVHEEEQSSSSVGRANGAGLHHSTSSGRPPGQFDGLELRGQSSYVRVTGDMISGDQLDQLLLQARNARA